MRVGQREAELLALLEVNGESHGADLAEQSPIQSLKPPALISLQCAEPRIAQIGTVPQREVVVPSVSDVRRVYFAAIAQEARTVCKKIPSASFCIHAPGPSQRVHHRLGTSLTLGHPGSI